MKKTKLLTIALSVPALAGVTAPLLLLTSCGDKDKYKDLNLSVTGDHLASYTTNGETKTNKQFLINCVFEDGWNRIDKTNTKLTAGNTELVKGDDYEINNDFQIVIKADRIKDTNVVVTVESVPTVVSYTYKFVGTSFKKYEGTPCFVPGDILRPSDVEFYAIKGDGKKYPIEWGKGSEQVKLIYEDTDVTEKFVSDGFKITEDMVKTSPETLQKEISQVDLKYYVYIDGHKSQTTLPASVGYRPGFIMIVEPEVEKYVVGESYQFGISGKAGAWNYAKFEIESQAVEEAAEIDEDGFLIAKKAGTVVVKATAYIEVKAGGSATSTSKSITIVAA